MSHPSQSQFEVGLSRDEHREAFTFARGIPTAVKSALAATACWYVAWFVFPIDVSAWVGIAVFSIAGVLGYALARLLLHRAVVDEVRRRRELLKLSEQLKQQHQFNQVKGE
jgi:hypothetical protein